MAVTLFDKTFELYIGAETIQERVREMAAAMNAGTVEIDYVGFRIPHRFVVGYGLDE